MVPATDDEARHAWRFSRRTRQARVSPAEYACNLKRYIGRLYRKKSTIDPSRRALAQDLERRLADDAEDQPQAKPKNDKDRTR